MLTVKLRLYSILLTGVFCATIASADSLKKCQSITCPFKLGAQVVRHSNCGTVCQTYFRLFKEEIPDRLRQTTDRCLAKNRKKCFGKEGERTVVTANSEADLVQAGFPGIQKTQPVSHIRPPQLDDVFCGCDAFLHLYQVRRPLTDGDPNSAWTQLCKADEVCQRIQDGLRPMFIEGSLIYTKWQSAGTAEVTNDAVICKDKPEIKKNYDPQVKWCSNCNTLCRSKFSADRAKSSIECHSIYSKKAHEDQQAITTGSQMRKKQKTGSSAFGPQQNTGHGQTDETGRHSSHLLSTHVLSTDWPFTRAFESSSHFSTATFAYGGALQYFEQTRQYQGLNRASTSHPSDNRARPPTSQGRYLARGSELAHQPQQLQELQLLDRFIIESMAEDDNGISTGVVGLVNDDVELSLTLAPAALASQNGPEQAVSISELTPASAEEESLNEQCQKDLLEQPQIYDFL